MNVDTAAPLQIAVDALVETGWRLWATSHSNTPNAQLVSRWMQAIAPGHLVLEVSTIKADRARDRVGVLLSITSNREYTIRTIDGRELRWENAEFVRIPQSAADNREIIHLGQLGERSI